MLAFDLELWLCLCIKTSECNMNLLNCVNWYTGLFHSIWHEKYKLLASSKLNLLILIQTEDNVSNKGLNIYSSSQGNLRVGADQITRFLILTGRRGVRLVAHWAPCGCFDPQGKPTCGRTGRERALGWCPKAQRERKLTTARQLQKHTLTFITILLGVTGVPLINYSS